MSFNEIAEFRELLSRISRERPGLINAGKRSLLWAIISQSAGCFVGYEELADQAGLKPGTVKTYLRELTDLNLILREQSYARRGVRQCYHVSLEGLRELVRVSPVTPIELDSALMGITESLKGATESVTGSNQSPTYRDLREYKEERVNITKIKRSADYKIRWKIQPDMDTLYSKYEKYFKEILKNATTK